MKNQENHTDNELEQVFVLCKQRQAFRRQAMFRPIMISDVVNLVMGREVGCLDEVMTAVNERLDLRRVYLALVNRQRLATTPKQAIAQDKLELTLRLGDGFVIKFRESAAGPDQIYVIIEADDTLEFKPNQYLSLIVTNEKSLMHLPFPPFSDGRTQCLLSAHDKRLKAIRDPYLEVTLVQGA